MSGSENTPTLDFGAAPSSRPCLALICAGQAVVTSSTDGVRVLEVNPVLELGRGQSTTRGVIPGSKQATPTCRELTHSCAGWTPTGR